MASWSSPVGARAVAAPVARPRRRARAKTRSSRRGVLWIAVSGILLAGVVFVNVAVLRLNLSLDDASRQRAKLHAENAALQSELSSALASPRIQAEALKQYHLTPADPSTFGYVDLAK